MPNVLIVDNDELYRQFLEILLARHGFTTKSLPTGRKVAAMIETNSFDLVITDLYMPDADGIETLRLVKKLTPGTHVLCLTGAGERSGSLKRAMLMFGAAAVLSKSLTGDQLMREILRFLEDGAAKGSRTERVG